MFLQDSAETAYAGALIFHPDWCSRAGNGKDAACGGNVLGGYCHAGGRPVVTLEQYPDYPVYNTGALRWGVAGSCGAETDDILAVFRGESSSITTAFRARTNTYGPAHRDVKLEVIWDLAQCGGRFYADALGVCPPSPPPT